MDEISTPFILYSDINTENIDIFEDAYGFEPLYYDIINNLKKIKPEITSDVTDRLIRKVRSTTISFG